MKVELTLTSNPTSRSYTPHNICFQMSRFLGYRTGTQGKISFVKYIVLKKIYYTIYSYISVSKPYIPKLSPEYVTLVIIQGVSTEGQLIDLPSSLSSATKS